MLQAIKARYAIVSQCTCTSIIPILICSILTCNTIHLLNVLLEVDILKGVVYPEMPVFYFFNIKIIL